MTAQLTHANRKFLATFSRLVDEWMIANTVHGIAVQLEVLHPPPAGWRIRIVRPFIYLLARLGGMEPQFIPYGLAGDRLPCAFLCSDCNHVFVTHLSLFNEDIVTCPRCGLAWRTGNDGSGAWIIAGTRKGKDA